MYDAIFVYLVDSNTQTMGIKNSRIEGVRTAIINKTQRVLLKLVDSNIPVDIPFEGILKLHPDIPVTKVECLMGSYFITEPPPESSDNRQGKDTSVSTKWTLKLEGPLEECIERNKDHLREFHLINNIQPIQFKGHPPSFRIDAFYSFFLPMSIFLSITGLKFEEHHLAIGSFITTETWNEGDWAIDPVMFEDFPDGYRRKVRKKGQILKDPTVRTSWNFDSVSQEHFKKHPQKRPFYGFR